jgi:hypothetical protein
MHCWSSHQLGRGLDLEKAHLTIPNHFVSEVLLNVNVFCQLTFPNDIVAPFDACSIVLIHTGRLLLNSRGRRIME